MEHQSCTPRAGNSESRMMYPIRIAPRPTGPLSERTAVPFAESGTLLRLSIGLEATEQLAEDLADGLARLKSTS